MNDKQQNYLILAVIVGIIGFLVYGSPIQKQNSYLVAQSPGYKEFNVVMENNRYIPSVLTVNLDDTVVINFINKDNVAHGVDIADFGATVPGGHVPPSGEITMTFIADQVKTVDAASCGGPNPRDKTDAHGEELIIDVI